VRVLLRQFCAAVDQTDRPVPLSRPLHVLFAGLHALRHTFLTEAGEYTDPFTLQYVAGHDNIKTTMRYVHTQANAVQKLFVRLANLDREQNGFRKARRFGVGAKSGAAATGP